MFSKFFQFLYLSIFRPKNLVRTFNSNFYVDPDTKLEMAIVSVLNEFVEKECPYMYLVLYDAKDDKGKEVTTKMLKRMPREKQAELGLKYLRAMPTENEMNEPFYEEIKATKQIDAIFADAYDFFKNYNWFDNNTLDIVRKNNYINSIIKHRQHMWT